MGEVEILEMVSQLVIHSTIITYGNAADPAITESIREEIETMWNEPRASLHLNNSTYSVRFRIESDYRPDITDLEIYQNINSRNNYFRIEEFAHGNISFVDGLGSNSGYFKLENLYTGSTTAAHEYGHTLGLEHPQYLDIRNLGVPGIMYPRGTLVDPQYQYDPAKPAGVTGGTMHPMYRKVRTQDVEALRLHRLQYHYGKAILGDFTNIYHRNHAEISADEFFLPPISG